MKQRRTQVLAVGAISLLISTLGVSSASATSSVDIFNAGEVLSLVAPELTPAQALDHKYAVVKPRIEFSTNQRVSGNGQGLSVRTVANRVDSAEKVNRQEGEMAVKRSPDTTIVIPFAKQQVSSNSLASVWETSSSDVSLYVREVANGVQFLTVLGDAASTSEFEYDITVPVGTTVRETSSGFAVSAADGTRLGHFATPWVRDATGASVPVKYSWNDGTVIQKIDVSDVDSSAFPLVAQSGWGYSKSYDVKATVGEAHTKLLNCFNCYFPVSGAPAAFPTFGQYLPLVVGPWPLQLDFSCTMGIRYWEDYGTSKSQYFGWGFEATSTHVDGLGSTINFDLSPTWMAASPNNVFSTLTVDAWIVNQNPGGVPNWIYQQSAEGNWATFATALQWD